MLLILSYMFSLVEVAHHTLRSYIHLPHLAKNVSSDSRYEIEWYCGPIVASAVSNAVCHVEQGSHWPITYKQICVTYYLFLKIANQMCCFQKLLGRFLHRLVGLLCLSLTNMLIVLSCFIIKFYIKCFNFLLVDTSTKPTDYNFDFLLKSCKFAIMNMHIA